MHKLTGCVYDIWRYIIYMFLLVKYATMGLQIYSWSMLSRLCLVDKLHATEVWPSMCRLPLVYPGDIYLPMINLLNICLFSYFDTFLFCTRLCLWSGEMCKWIVVTPQVTDILDKKYMSGECLWIQVSSRGGRFRPLNQADFTYW